MPASCRGSRPCGGTVCRSRVICVVGAGSLDAADELVDFFIAEDIRDVGFNIEEIEGAHRRSSLNCGA